MREKEGLFDLPESWSWTIASEVCASVRDGTHDTPKYVEKGIPLITSKNLREGELDFSTAKFISLEDHQQISIRSGVEDGDVLFAMIGTVGNPVLVKADKEFSIKNVGLFKKNDSVIDSRYLKFWLSSFTLDKLIEKQSLLKGTTQKFVPLGNLRNLPTPLPPLNEQRRIVAKIEALKARSQRVKEELEAIAPLLDQFRQSVLAAAFCGDLTADWREKNPDVEPASRLLQKILKAHELAGGHKRGNAAPPTDGVHNLTSETFPQTWEIAELKDICEPGRPITYGILKPGFDVQDGVPYIRVADFPNDQLNPESIRKTSSEIDAQYARSRLKTGDLLLSIRGTVGRLCKIPTLLNGANITQDSARLSIQSNVSSDYVFLFIKAQSTQQRMQKAIKGVAVRGINIGDVRAIQIPLPPYLEQQELVRRVEALLKTADCIKQQYKEAKSHLDQLDHSILAKAFRGELVPQDPNDEPASVLLERIRAEREKLDTKKKAKGKSEKKSRKAQPEPAEPKQLSLPGFE
ncbi:restriction endonuclease subunit S [Microcoleus sp. Pol7_A1]|uniref:restriction endonuclease subunit S n=1 Tax=Microcoleus sp. Pol7_A1 TaxID=2818893 RepID=UPI002FD3E35F